MLNLERHLMGRHHTVAGEQVFGAEADILAGPRRSLELAGITVNFLGLVFSVFAVGGFLFFLFVPFANPYIGLVAFIGMPVLFLLGIVMYFAGSIMEGFAKKSRRQLAQ